MRRNSSYLSLLVAVIGAVSTACESGGVGDPCIPEDEYRANFPGFTVDQVNVESRSFQCETRLCLVANFQGRVSCPYGSAAGACYLPGSDDETVSSAVEVLPQVMERRADDAVYCSCRCDGPDPNAQYCECPSGFSCKEQIANLGIDRAGQLIGSYCTKAGKHVENPEDIITTNVCRGDECGEPNPYGPGAN